MVVRHFSYIHDSGTIKYCVEIIKKRNRTHEDKDEKKEKNELKRKGKGERDSVKNLIICIIRRNKYIKIELKCVFICKVMVDDMFIK